MIRNEVANPNPNTRITAVINHYRTEIDEGRLRVGDKLPSLDKLPAKHEISRATAAKVIRQLREEGYIRTDTTGSYVFMNRIDRVWHNLCDAFNEVEKVGEEPQLVVANGRISVRGNSAAIVWDEATRRWELERSALGRPRRVRRPSNE